MCVWYVQAQLQGSLDRADAVVIVMQNHLGSVLTAVGELLQDCFDRLLDLQRGQ